MGLRRSRLLALAREHRMTIGAGLVESDGERLFNSYVVAMPDGQYRCHRKIQAFESEYISAGSEYTVFDTPHGVRVGVLICYDNNIIENVRITALAGAQVLLAPHQTGGRDSLSPHGMKPIDPKLWHDRHANPGPIRAEILGSNGRGMAFALAAVASPRQRHVFDLRQWHRHRRRRSAHGQRDDPRSVWQGVGRDERTGRRDGRDRLGFVAHSA